MKTRTVKAKKTPRFFVNGVEITGMFRAIKIEFPQPESFVVDSHVQYVWPYTHDLNSITLNLMGYAHKTRRGYEVTEKPMKKRARKKA